MLASVLRLCIQVVERIVLLHVPLSIPTSHVWTVIAIISSIQLPLDV